MRWKVLIGVGLAAAAAAFVGFGGYAWMTEDGNVERLLTESGIWGPVLFVVVMWVTQPFGVPGFVYMVPAGLVWPAGLAIGLSWVGNMGASWLAFVFARWFARDWVAGRIPPKLHRFDDRLSDGGVGPVVLLRVITGQLPAADWLLGVTRVNHRSFLIGTGIGIIPGICVFVLAGGSIFESWGDLPQAVRYSLIGAALAFAVVRRVIARRRKLAQAVAAPA